MQILRPFFFIVIFLVLQLQSFPQTNKPSQPDPRLEWWRDARFGMFIHWGLYAVPAGEWNGKTGYGEWIRSSAEIPLETYNQFVPQFNPILFDADAWVKMAKGGRHEVHRDHLQAPRRLLHVRDKAD
jgi:hypothetical protein